MSQVKSAATQTFDGIAQNMAAMLTGSEQKLAQLHPFRAVHDDRNSA
ncbi:putative phage tail tape measure protein [Escherichia coli]|nr:putative phage tail tape measure protein [Escherichia coli]